MPVTVDVTDGPPYEGIYEGASIEALEIELADGSVARVPLRQVRSISTKTARGSYWGAGLAVGLAADLAVFVIAAAALVRGLGSAD